MNVKPQAAAPESERETWGRYIAASLAGNPATAPERGRLIDLAALFGLDTVEVDSLATLWVAGFDPSLRAELVRADPWSLQLTPFAIARIFGHPLRLRLRSESPLRTWHLADERETGDSGALLVPDPQIIAWLEGEHELDRALVGRVRMAEPGETLPSWPVDYTAAAVRAGLPAGTRWRIRIATTDTLAALDFAVAVAAQLGLPLLAVEPGALAGENVADCSLRLHRQAYLDRAALYYDTGETLAPCGVPPFPVQFAGGTAALPPLPGVRDLTVELAAPDAAERRTLWLRAHPEAAAWPEAELAQLTLDYDANSSEIARAAGTAPANAREAAQRIREAARDDLGGLAQRIDCAFRWDDLVVPPVTRERLADIAFEARERSRLWAEPEAARLYPHGRGLVALFAGPPGTGKTMAAQVIAGELGLDLLRIDLSAVLSKWVGETAQHLQKVLSARVSRRSVLFFDEADALYGKRVEEVRDAQDRYANMDVSHLMVALENFDGIVLLATNLKANIDPAFIRRIRHLIDFVKPDASARAEIWWRALAALFGLDTVTALAPDLPRLVQVEASGAQIKNAALSAVFAARRARRAPDLGLLARMLARELAKDGCGLSTRELAAFAEDAS